MTEVEVGVPGPGAPYPLHVVIDERGRDVAPEVQLGELYGRRLAPTPRDEGAGPIDQALIPVLYAPPGSETDDERRHRRGVVLREGADVEPIGVHHQEVIGRLPAVRLHLQLAPIVAGEPGDEVAAGQRVPLLGRAAFIEHLEDPRGISRYCRDRELYGIRREPVEVVRRTKCRRLGVGAIRLFCLPLPGVPTGTISPHVIRWGDRPQKPLQIARCEGLLTREHAGSNPGQEVVGLHVYDGWAPAVCQD